MNQTEANTTEEHGMPIKTPRQLITTIVLAFIIPVVIIVLLVNLVISSSRLGAGSDSLSPEAIASRIKPVASFSLVDANAPKEMKTGQQVYDSTCSACHAAGVAGAPKVGDSAAWAPLIESGMATMLKIAIEGKGAMPAKGGNPALDDFEIERAIVLMANQSGASFPEPVQGEESEGSEAAPAADAPAAEAPASAEPDAQAESNDGEQTQPDAAQGS